MGLSLGSKEATFDDVKEVVDNMRTDWNMLSICDIVLNHTANETAWVTEHPEATYNLVNCPYMRPAFLVRLSTFPNNNLLMNDNYITNVTDNSVVRFQEGTSNDPHHQSVVPSRQISLDVAPNVVHRLGDSSHRVCELRLDKATRAMTAYGLRCKLCRPMY